MIRIKEEKINETFRASKTAEMVLKLMKVIAKKAGLKVDQGGVVPDYFQNKIGSFVGFFIRYNSTKLIRFNFLQKGSSDNIYSIDLMNLTTLRPGKTINLLGYNVVEVVDYISDVLTGDYSSYAEDFTDHSLKRFNERKALSAVTADWLDQNHDAKAKLADAINRNLRGARLDAALEAVRPSFETYRDAIGFPSSRNAKPEFKINVKKYFTSQGVDASVIPSIEVVNGESNETPTAPTENERIYNDFIANEHFIKFKILRTYCFQIAKGNKAFKGLYIYGDGGIGKSFWVNKILTPLPNATKISGKVQGYTGVVQLFYNNREDGKILILDDVITGKDMANEGIQTILKAALDLDNGHIDVLKRESISKTPEELVEIEESMDMVDITDELEDSSSFQFGATVVFITNYAKVPQPVEDRCWVLKMEFNNHQILDLISLSLHSSIPEADENIVESVFERVDPIVTGDNAIAYLKGFADEASLPRKFSFRVFHRVVALMSLGFKDDTLMQQAIRIELG